jgi:hypothetical protein
MQFSRMRRSYGRMSTKSQRKSTHRSSKKVVSNGSFLETPYHLISHCLTKSGSHTDCRYGSLPTVSNFALQPALLKSLASIPTVGMDLLDVGFLLARFACAAYWVLSILSFHTDCRYGAPVSRVLKFQVRLGNLVGMVCPHMSHRLSV